MKIYSIDPATQARLGQYHDFIIVANSKEEALSLIKTEGQKWLLENVSEEGIYTGKETEPFIMSSSFFGS